MKPPFPWMPLVLMLAVQTIGISYVMAGDDFIHLVLGAVACLPAAWLGVALESWSSQR
jgi:hypothetical protein